MIFALSQVASSLNPIDVPGGGIRRRTGLYMELGKARLSLLVVVTAGAGYLLGATDGIAWTVLGWFLVGTSLAAGCANGLNQVMEVDRDARMARTRGRPLPSGRMGALHAAVAATIAGGVGLTILAAFVNMVTALLAALTIGIYLLVYTPLKARSTLNTLVGAVVGAIPPMMGWTAATGRIEMGAWALATVLFVWQIPHFLSLAWMYREDYAAGGYRMLPAADPTGIVTFRTVLMWTAALIPATLWATLLGVTGMLSAIVAIALGAWMILLAIRLHREQTHDAARKLFLATITYLPVLMIVMVLDRSPLS